MRQRDAAYDQYNALERLARSQDPRLPSVRNVLPADGWRGCWDAGPSPEDAAERALFVQPLVGWALVDLGQDPVTGDAVIDVCEVGTWTNQAVIGLVAGSDGVNLIAEDSNFVGYLAVGEDPSILAEAAREQARRRAR